MPTDPVHLARRWNAIYIAAILFVSLPYVITFASQLVSDDFILLYYYGRRPLWRVWEFFSPATIWTYHPLQHYYFAVGWHLSGIEPWSYRTVALALHLATALLAMKFARDLSGSVHVGGWTALLFAGQWRHWETVAWAASIATLQSTFFTILTATAFLSFLRRRRGRAYALMLAAGVGWMFAKETVVQWPVLLAAIYFFWRWREAGREDRPSGSTCETASSRPPRGAVADGAILLAVPAMLVMGYLCFRFTLVRNVYTYTRLGYEQAPLHLWPRHVLAWLDRTLNPLLDNEVAEEILPLRLLYAIGAWHVLSLAALLVTALLAVVLRRMFSLFALTMTLIAMMPYALLQHGYSASRYHYAAMLGGSLLLAVLGHELWRRGAGKRGGWSSAIRVATLAVGGLWVVAGLFQLTNRLLGDRAANRQARELYEFFTTQTDKADRSVLFVVDTEPVRHEVEVELGWGLLECARLAVGSDSVAAVELGFDVEPQALALFNACREKYLVERSETGPWNARRIPDDCRLTVQGGDRRGVQIEDRL